jgi:hypothetical protein
MRTRFRLAIADGAAGSTAGPSRWTHRVGVTGGIRGCSPLPNGRKARRLRHASIKVGSNPKCDGVLDEDVIAATASSAHQKPNEAVSISPATAAQLEQIGARV